MLANPAPPPSPVFHPRICRSPNPVLFSKAHWIKNVKKGIPILLAALFLASGLRTGQAFEWRTDLNQALADARQKNRLLLIYFSGSDWCGYCRVLDAEVFSKPRFQEFAEANLVTVQADFPQAKPQPEALQIQNERLQRQFQVEGFPTLLVFSPEGELIAQLGYEPGGPDVIIQRIRSAQQALARYRLRNPARPPAAPSPS